MHSIIYSHLRLILSSTKSEAYFKLSYSRIIFNVALTACSVIQPDKQGMPLKFKIYIHLFLAITMLVKLS